MSFRRRLREAVTIDKPIEKASPKDVLEFLTDKYEFQFVADRPAFADAGCEAAEDQQVSLPAVTGVPLVQVLDDILAQANGTFRVGHGVVRVVPAKP